MKNFYLDKEQYLSHKIPFINNRILSYWILKGILNPINGNGKRKKLSFIEINWLRIVHILRQSEISFDVIKILQSQLFLPCPIINKGFSNVNKNVLFMYVAKIIKPVLKSIKTQNRIPSYFEVMLITSIVLNTPSFIYISFTQKVIFIFPECIDQNLLHLDNSFNNRIVICISDQIKYFLSNDDFVKPFE